jgi:hypothetical protein
MATFKNCCSFNEKPPIWSGMTGKKYAVKALRSSIARGMVVVGALWHVLFHGSALCNPQRPWTMPRAHGVTLFVPGEPQITGVLGGALRGKADVLAGHEVLPRNGAPLSER